MALDKKFWAEYFEVYDVLNELIPYQELMQDIIDALDVKKGELIIDAGSGTGNLSMRMEDVGARVVAVDFSEEGQRIHKKKNPKQTQFVLADLNKKLPFEDESFDKVVSNNVLYTIPKNKRENVIKEFYRILKPKGKVVINNPSKDFKMTHVFFDYLKKDIKNYGIIKTLIKFLKLILPIIKITFYNYKIKKENKTGKHNFFDNHEKKELLEKSGFLNISDNIKRYSGQSILVSANK